jgi:hypothetical protein
MNIIAWYQADVMWSERPRKRSEFFRKLIRDLDADKNASWPSSSHRPYIGAVCSVFVTIHPPYLLSMLRLILNIALVCRELQNWRLARALRNSAGAPEFFSKPGTESLTMIAPDQIDQIKENMEVVGNDGLHVGVIVRVEAGEIRLAKNDTPDGLQHLLPLANVEYVDDRVHLNRSSIRAMAEWR